MSSDAQLNVLIIEDEALVAMELREALTECGYAVVGLVADSRDALEIVARAEVDVALVDLNLRDGLTGVTLASRLIEDHGVIVIFVTGNVRSIPNHFCGALGVVQKPYDSDRIGEVVQFAAAVRNAARREMPKRPPEIRVAPWLKALGG